MEGIAADNHAMIQMISNIFIRKIYNINIITFNVNPLKIKE
jgi:hypothetical protein